MNHRIKKHSLAWLVLPLIVITNKHLMYKNPSSIKKPANAGFFIYQFYQNIKHSFGLNNSLAALNIIYIEQLYIVIFALLTSYLSIVITAHLFNAIGIAQTGYYAMKSTPSWMSFFSVSSMSFLACSSNALSSP